MHLIIMYIVETCNNLMPIEWITIIIIQLRYHQPLSLLPATCDGCGEVFGVSPALDCRKGG